MNLSTLAGSAGVQALGWTLLHFLWQGAIIAAALAVALAGLPRGLARARYAACCVALVLSLLAPLATLLALLHRFGAEPALPPRLGGPTASGPWESVPLLLSAAWALGSAGMSLRLALGFARLRQMLERCAPVPREWQARVEALARRLGIARAVRLAVSPAVDAPLTLGWLRPVIVLPVGVLGSLPAAYLEALLIHELAHVRRLDYLVNILQAGVEALLFYHPAVHWMSHRLRLEREYCCDDVAASAVGDPIEYARALTAMETWRALPALALGASGGSLLSRLERLVRRPAPGVSSARASTALAGALAAAGSLALVTAWACGADGDAGGPAPGRAQNQLTASGAPSAEAAPNGQGAPSAEDIDVAWFPPELRRWEPVLAAAAERHGVDPILVAIVTLVESLGDPQAHSPAGAVGLMQLMPSTAARIAAVRELDGYSEALLWDPDYNVDLGAWYLSRQRAEFAPGSVDDAAVALAAVAYNAGPGRTRAWGQGAAELPAETRTYRDLVVGMWRERARAESPTFDAWSAALAARRTE